MRPPAEYDQSMSARITVSLPDELVARAHAAVAAGRAASVSAYVAEALREKTSRESVAAVLADWRSEVGDPTPDEEAWAREALARVMGDRD